MCDFIVSGLVCKKKDKFVKKKNDKIKIKQNKIKKMQFCIHDKRNCT